MKPERVKRGVVIGVLAVLVASYFFFDLGRFFSLEYIKSSREAFQAVYAQHSLAVIAVYFLLYVLTTALALPAATVLTLIGGAVFGLIAGTVIISFASSIGAAIAFLIARYLLRDWVQSKFGHKLNKVNKGIEAEGAFYLFTLRLIPVFPFFMINTVMALTPMRLFTYYWVSQLGMFPATVVYVNAGKELGQLESLSGLLSPGLIASFVVLGVFPLFMKMVIARYHAWRQNHG